MAASFMHWGLNPKVATDYDVATGIHTLKMVAATPTNTNLFAKLGLNPKMETDEVAGVHTIKAKVV